MESEVACGLRRSAGSRRPGLLLDVEERRQVRYDLRITFVLCAGSGSRALMPGRTHCGVSWSLAQFTRSFECLATTSSRCIRGYPLR